MEDRAKREQDEPEPLTGYPVVNDPNHPGQVKDQYMSIPANGKFGSAAPLPSFLQNLAKP